ncbi:3-hydroxyacyl-CoA dehydrogenase/enoyl-CoA hydratase family protein [Ferroacidibacillus organovorans]|uniref:3-hydroxyacyl-CoA dehydrogenase n=1 Tax=Ferroacidibacillus organovorans TaxID=1765683 RepID=A0A853KGE0_9BACL|nr:3-hydroxyacyl-CoA dehydrogenase/enoyl-CoA hydratase family protein [Ferroacidibacillus organovorans]KYP80869.1 3-hydroxyacyl-CoA dehydrogenase [Ferroacidibacillus organovorans]OAG95414.1 3-hydroxyacyl-CoA dehydrogenase [Ferroacidibacillus organovorans]
MISIKRAAVLGSGVMGAAIAGHLANVGIPSLLLDIVPAALLPEEEKKGLSLSDKRVRNRYADRALANLLKAKPAPLYTKEQVKHIETGNFEDDFKRIEECDWIIEVVVENLAIKKQVLERVDAFRRQGSVVSSNTSGVSIEAMAAELSADFQKNFLGTHFFNPPRYMKLIELIPTANTDPAVVAAMETFCSRVLGKGVVIAKDTPNFIANRIGTFGLLVTLREMAKTGFGVDEVDTLTGPVMGRPKSATFRTLDLVGLDTFVHVAKNVLENSTDERERDVFTVPTALLEMVAKGYLGDKSGQGFFKKQRGANGTEILAIELSDLSYRARRKLRSASFDAAKTAATLSEKLCALAYGKDKAASFIWSVLKQVLIYSASLVGVIADDIAAIDNAMKWGFNWEFGPFETWDALGLAHSVKRMTDEGENVPSFVLEMAEKGQSFYLRDNGVTSFHTRTGYQKLEQGVHVNLAALKAQGREIFSNQGATLLDLGDDVACLHFHSLKQAIGGDMVSMMMRSADEVEKNYRALVIGANATNFCVGANIMMMLAEAQDENWDEIDLAIRQFQNATSRMKFMKRPVVVAPYGLTLGGGAEIALSGSAIQAAGETYLGLVETGIGLIPGGGGNKELLMRVMENVPDLPDVPLLPFVQKAFETIALAKVSSSALDAKSLGFLTERDRVTVGQDFLLSDAKQRALELAIEFVPKKPAHVRVAGENGAAALTVGVYGMKRSGYISDHDEKVAKQLIRVLTGGQVQSGTLMSEQSLLDLEREAFLSLLGEAKTQARMQHMLQTGKPLRN